MTLEEQLSDLLTRLSTVERRLRVLENKLVKVPVDSLDKPERVSPNPTEPATPPWMIPPVVPTPAKK